MASTPGTAALKQLIREHLLANAAVVALVGTNVFGVHMEDADAGTVLKGSPMVVFEGLSGNLRWHGALATQTLEIYGYSKRNSIEASKVYDAVADAMQHECMKITGIPVTAVARETQRPLDGYNNNLNAWFVRGRWTLEVI